MICSEISVPLLARKMKLKRGERRRPRRMTQTALEPPTPEGSTPKCTATPATKKQPTKISSRMAVYRIVALGLAAGTAGLLSTSDVPAVDQSGILPDQ